MPSASDMQGGQNESKNHDRGIMIIIEGADGSGKSTQYNLLKERLLAKGYRIKPIHFPRYDEPSSYFVHQYLNGSYGSANDVGPYTSSLFYALDRYEAARDIHQALEDGYIVLCDRYTGSNMAHQGTKFASEAERRGYFLWLDNLEFQLLAIPRPDLNFVLDVPAEVLIKRLEDRPSSSKDIKKDVHEASTDHIRQAVEVYRDLTEMFPKDFLRIESERSGQLLDKETIQRVIWEKVEPLLPVQQHIDKHDHPIAHEENPYLRQGEHALEMTSAGKGFLERAITNIDSNVYAFTGENITPITTAAAMARLSRRGDDMRITILDEFAQAAQKDEALLKRVITAYGDDSVQQLVGTHLVVENASQLLTKKLEWGRLAAYLEQSTRYIYYDQKQADGTYKYHIPANIEGSTRATYIATMDTIFATYSTMVRQLTDYIRQQSKIPASEQDGAWKSATRAQACDAVRPVLPAATTSTVGIYASGQAIESLIMHLRAEPLIEMQQVGEQILAEARKVIPAFLERADRPERGGAMVAYRSNTNSNVSTLAKELLPDTLAPETDEVQLTDYWPRNEMDLVADMLYEHSNRSLRDIRQEVETWSYQQKLQVMQAYVGERLNRRHRPGRALEKAHYSWDLVCDYGIFRDLQRHRMVDDLAWQQLTPRYGYAVPDLIEAAGLTDEYESCFERSLELYSQLQAAGYYLEAQYATLLGHKMRWKLTYNAREAFHFHELRTSPQGHPGYRKLVNEMHQKLAERHPILAEAMKFVNKDEDPELTRLAAERYTQFKLNQSKHS